MIEFYEFHFLREDNYLPSMTHPYSKLFLGRLFLIVNRFWKFLQHILGQTKRRILQRKYLLTVE